MWQLGEVGCGDGRGEIDCGFVAFNGRGLLHGSVVGVLLHSEVQGCRVGWPEIWQGGFGGLPQWLEMTAVEALAGLLDFIPRSTRNCRGIGNGLLC